LANAFIIGQGTGTGAAAAASNASVGLNGGTGPTSSTQIGDIVGGVFTAFSATNPVPITGTILANNSSVGATGVAAPAFATEIGVISAGGLLVGASASNPVRIDPTGTTVQPVSGTITVVQPTGTNLHVFVDNAIFSAGTLSNNTAAPIADNVGVLPAVATAANPTLIEGNQVLLSADLSGNMRVKVNAPLPAGTNVIGHVIADTGSTTAVTGTVAVTQSTSPWVVSGTVTANAGTGTFTVGGTVAVSNFPASQVVTLASTTITGTVAVTQSTSPWVVSGTVTATIATPTDWGTAPAISVLVPAVNAELFAGQTALTATGTSLNVNVTNTVPVTLASTTITGTVAVTQSTSPWVVSGTITANAGTGNFTVVQPTGTNLHVVVDSGVITSITNPVAVTGTFFQALQNVNVTQWDTVALGAPSAYGTSPGAVNVIGVNAFITNTPAVTLASTTITGTVAVTQSTSPWVVSGTVAFSNTTIAVTNTGTFAVQATLAAGSAVIGHVITDSGSVTNATLSAETTKVIGTVNQGTSPWVVSGAVTVASTTITGTVAVTQSTSPWVVSGTITANAGTGNFTVVQPTGTNLHVVIDSGTITAVTAITNPLPAGTNVIGHVITDSGSVTNATLSAETTKVIGTVNQGTSPWVISGAVTVASTTITGTVAVTQSTSPWVVSLASTTITGTVAENLTQVAGVVLGATAVTAYGTAPAAANVPGVNAFITNSPAVTISTGAGAVTGTGGSLNVNVTNAAGPFTVVGNKTNNNAAPDGNNIGVLPFQANAAAPTWTEGDLVTGSVDLNGRQRTLGGGVYSTTIPALTTGTSSPIQIDSTGAQYINPEVRKATYSAFATFTAAAGDIAVLPGSASTTIRVTRVEVSISTSGTSAIEAVQLVKRSAADTGGTSAAMTAVPHDSAFAAASAAPLSYTVAPSLGAAVGAIRGVQFNDSSNTALPGANTWLWTFGGDRPSSTIVLRGVAQELCINLGGAVATQTAVVSFEWTEE
jgi:hypothetical protein